ncbi:MAG: thiolase family protein [Candidatus Bipolaricaulota bacterium]|nr:thiolase family protein [Candidatus Bipolaricaulota bacterium]
MTVSSGREPVIVAAVRTPIGKHNGFFKDTRADELGVIAIQALLERTRISPSEIEDVVFGCVTGRGEQGFNVARIIALEAGLPIESAGVTVNRLCGSSQQAIHFAAQEILAGVCDCAIAGGVESMTREPMGSDLDKPLNPKLLARYEIVHQGEAAERIADRWRISREELDEFSLQSHLKAAHAQDAGYFESQIVPVTLNNRTLKHDEGVRRYASPEEGRAKLAQLAPVFRPGIGKITAGNSSQISDGAAALLLMTREKAKALGYKPMARFRAWAVAGVDPTIMLTGPIPATKKALHKAGLTLKDIDLFECNEAFAPVPIAWGRELDVPWERVNVNGGAIAHGHPLGATGAILFTKILYELERRDAQFGLVTMCIGFGQGIATVLERL